MSFLPYVMMIIMSCANNYVRQTQTKKLGNDLQSGRLDCLKVLIRVQNSHCEFGTVRKEVVGLQTEIRRENL